MSVGALRTLPLDIDMSVFVGASLRREFRWMPSGDTYADLAGWDALMLIGPQGGTAITELTKGDGITLTSQGQIIVEVDAVTTASYAGADPIYSSVAQRPTARLFYSLDLTDPAGFVQRFARGRIDVIVDVARRP